MGVIVGLNMWKNFLYKTVKWSIKNIIVIFLIVCCLLSLSNIIIMIYSWFVYLECWNMMTLPYFFAHHTSSSLSNEHYTSVFVHLIWIIKRRIMVLPSVEEIIPIKAFWVALVAPVAVTTPIMVPEMQMPVIMAEEEGQVVVSATITVLELAMEEAEAVTIIIHGNAVDVSKLKFIFKIHY